MESKEGNDALFQYATEGILVTNTEGQIIRINPSAEQLFGYEHGELEGKKIENLIPQRFTQRHEINRENYSHHPHARSMGAGMELFGLKKDGSEFPVEISLSPFKNENGSFVIAFIIDVTIRKEAEFRMKTYFADLEKQVKNRTLVLEEAIAELEKTKKNLDISLAKEKELNEMKSRFVSMASHEFRTPLTTMMSSVSLIAKYHERNDDVNHQKHVAKVKSSINNLTDILNDFLSVSKLEEGKITNNPEEINIRLFISEIVSEMRTMLLEKQVINEVYSGDEIVQLDPKILKNILLNLFSNAIKFSPADGIVELSVKTTSDEILIAVKDHGIGISKEDQEQLFERFFRGSNATHIQGTGLGLNIVARYVELMNGTIQIKSVEHEGTEVLISIRKS
nr:PAS domain-containing sensor histidine kinase [uncultured Fluviicola sp.]